VGIEFHKVDLIRLRRLVKFSIEVAQN
jgi:hypothetical protein